MKSDPVHEITARADALGVTINQVLKKAKVPASTFHRWKKGEYGPTMKTYNRIITVLERLERAA